MAKKENLKKTANKYMEQLHDMWHKQALDHLVAGYAMAKDINLIGMSQEDYKALTIKIKDEIKEYNAKYNKEASNGSTTKAN